MGAKHQGGPPLPKYDKWLERYCITHKVILQEGEHKRCDVRWPPSLKTLTLWAIRDEMRSPDGCEVHLDGTCPHGHKSWAILLNLI